MYSGTKELNRIANASIKKQRYACPTTASEAYSLGISTKEAVFETYVLLIDHCNDPEIERFLSKMANLEKRETKDFSAWLNYELNCACSTFYESGGTVQSHLTDPEISNLAPSVNLNVDQFYAEISSVNRFLVEWGGDELCEHRGIAEEKDAFQASMKARMVCHGLYERLALLYPEGEIRSAFRNMADILAENTQKIKEEYTHHL